MRRRLVVLGDVLLDREIVGTSTRLCPDAPAPVVDIERIDEGPGGAGLAATLAVDTDVAVTLIAPLATDESGERIRAGLQAAGVDIIPLAHEGGTRTKTRIRTDDLVVARLDDGGPGRPVGDLPREALSALAEADGVLVSCYGGGTSALTRLRSVLTTRGSGVPVVWDPHPRGAEPVPGCTVITPNLAEAAGACGREIESPDALAIALAHRWRSESVSVTVGADGAWLARPGTEAVHLPAAQARPGDSCGAGDQYAAAVARALLQGQGVEDAVRAGVAAATAWVDSGGASAHRLATSTGRRSTIPTQEPVHRADEAAARFLVRELHQQGRSVVATGGCFDVLHAGHVQSLESARRLGDALVVLLNSDESVRRLKGPSRPVQPQEDRAKVLLALAAVDAVVIFDEDEPSAVLSRLRPDVWAKGADYAATVLPEAELVRGWGGRVQFLPLLPGRSTTAILKDAG